MSDYIKYEQHENNHWITFICSSFTLLDNVTATFSSIWNHINQNTNMTSDQTGQSSVSIWTKYHVHKTTAQLPEADQGQAQETQSKKNSEIPPSSLRRVQLPESQRNKKHCKNVSPKWINMYFEQIVLFLTLETARNIILWLKCCRFFGNFVVAD